MNNIKCLIKIDKEFINYLRISYRCPDCRKQVLLTPDIWDKEYLTCGQCQYSLHIRSNQAQFLKDLLFEFDKYHKILEMNGLQVWIEGQSEPNRPFRAHTTVTYTRDNHPSH